MVIKNDIHAAEITCVLKYSSKQATMHCNFMMSFKYFKHSFWRGPDSRHTSGGNNGHSIMLIVDFPQ
jgi:hypothetical protein